MQTTIPCFDRYAKHKLFAVLLTGGVLLGLSAFLLQAPAPLVVVHQLPQVVVEGHSQPSQAARAQQLLEQAPTSAGQEAPAQLPRVIIEGRRSPITLAAAVTGN